MYLQLISESGLLIKLGKKSSKLLAMKKKCVYHVFYVI